VIVFSAEGLQHIVNAYVTYDMRSRTHLSLEKDSPTPRPVMRPPTGRIVALPDVNGLHHRYDRIAA
jgi:putative transposase